MKKFTIFLLFFLCIPFLTFAQKTIEAKDIIKQINKGQTVDYENAEIVGDLDFSLIEDVTKKRRFASTSTFTYHINVPVKFHNCVFKGGVLGVFFDASCEEHVPIEDDHKRCCRSPRSLLRGDLFEDRLKFKEGPFML